MRMATVSRRLPSPPAVCYPERRDIVSGKFAAVPRNTTADDITEYYIAHCYDEVSSWIAERKAQA
jgi:hypothetical protein